MGLDLQFASTEFSACTKRPFRFVESEWPHSMIGRLVGDGPRYEGCRNDAGQISSGTRSRGGSGNLNSG
jgi:hypothetical protein